MAISDNTREKIKQDRMSMSWKQLVDKYALPRSTIRDICRNVKSDQASEDEGFQSKSVESNNEAVKDFVTSRPIKTLEDAIAAAEVDLSIWIVDRWEVSNWTVGMKVDTENGKKPVQTQQYRVKLYLKRIIAKELESALEIVYKRFKDIAPRRTYKKPDSVGEKFLAVFGLMDVHFGKLSWSAETGENYDLKIAETMLRNAVEDLISECSGRNIEKILLPFGNDYVHVDGRDLSTTKGTPQDFDGRFSRVLATAIQSAIWAVDRIAEIAPVQVELVPGNHDRTLSECICHVIAARFHDNNRVTVGLDPKTRKYVRYGVNLIGLAHGDLVKPDKLPNLMPADAKKDWAETTCHEWITGHGHRSQKWTTMDTDTTHGVVVRQLRGLTRADLWHWDNGHVTPNQSGAEVYFYGFSRGYAGHSCVWSRSN